ncbi:PREDICTED: trypsin-1-like, partial [Ceratosolen solmsi marchali]|uniref:Trypsin-1-like n=1 Tax=Ceratosolen solmsi marchali TaxID=326594 RepID=A0AAJ7DYR4_9HYME
ISPNTQYYYNIIILYCTEYGRVVASISDSRIVDGYDAKIGEFPHIVSLQSRPWDSRILKHFCGGSIIRAKWILTAGHCVGLLPNPDVFVVKAGKYKINMKEITEQVGTVEQSFVHKLYRGYIFIYKYRGTAPYDIALLKLHKAFKFNQYVDFIDIPHPNAKTFGNVTLAGWGSISNSQSPEYPSNLQTARLPILDFNTCNDTIVKTLHRSLLHSTNICTGSPVNEIAPCSGDSGSPLMTINKDYSQLVGIVSWGMIPCGMPDIPSIYTRVSAFVEWIEETISKNS